MKIKHIIEYIVAKPAVACIFHLPLGAVNKIGKTLGTFAYYAVPFRKKIALINLRAVFPEKTEQERKLICKNAYRSFGMTFLEYLRLATLPKKELLKMVIFDPPSLLHEVMARGKGAIMVTGHFSSFELLAITIGNSGIPVDMVVKPMRNILFEKRVIKRIREQSGCGQINMKTGFLKVAETIAKKRMIALAVDQDAGSKGFFVDFLGISSSMYGGPALLALRSRAPLVAVFIVREKPGRYRAYSYEISHESLSGSKDSVKTIIQEYTKLLESYIRRYPEQYFWMHKRWKSSGLYSK